MKNNNEQHNIELRLTEIFSKYGAGQDTSNLKKEVFKAMDTYKLVGNILNLYTEQLTQTEIKFLDALLAKKNKNVT